MKKIIAWITGIAVLMCCAVPVFSFDEEEIKNFKPGDEYKDGIIEEHPTEITYADAEGSVFYSDIEDYSEVGILSALGVVSAKEGSLFKPNVYVSRAEFTEALLKLMNIDYSSAEGLGNGEFFDVDKDSPYYNIVYNALACDIISGYENNSFRPENVMTYSEALISVMRALGYTEGIGNYFNIASDIHITKGIKVKNAAAITRMEMAKLLFNALEAPTCERILKNGGTAYSATGKSLLYSKWNMYKDKGIVTSSFTETIGSQSPQLYSVVINGARYQTKSEANQYFMGYLVNYYYDEDDSLVYMYKDKLVEEIVISADDFIEYTPNRVIKYYDGTKQKTEALPIDYTLLYNGMKPTENYTDTEIFDIAEGDIRLISNDGGSTYSVVMIEEYRNFLLKGSALNGSNIDLLLDNGRIGIDLSDTHLAIYDENGSACEVYRTTSDGEEVINISDLKENSIISIYSEYGKWDSSGRPDSRSKYIKIVCSAKTCEGTITGFFTDDYVVSVDKKEYKIAKYGDGEHKNTYLDTQSLQAGSDVKYYLDFNDKIVYSADKDMSEEWQYVYLAKIKYSEDEEKVVSFKVFNTGEEMKLYELSDKVKINGRKVKPNQIMDKLAESAAYLSAGRNVNVTHSQLLKIKAEENVVTEIQTLVQSVGKNANYPETQLFRHQNSALSDTSKLVLADSDSLGILTRSGSEEGLFRKPTIVMKVPITESDNPDDYAVQSLPVGSMVIDLYDVDNMTPAIGVLYKDETTQKALGTGFDGRTDIPVMLGKKHIALNEDGEVVLKFEVCQATGVQEYATDKQAVIDTINSLDKGSILKLYGTEKNVTAVDVVYYKGKPLGPKNLPWDELVSSEAIGLSTDIDAGSGQQYFYEVASVYSSSYFCLQNGPRLSDGINRANQVVGVRRNGAWQFGAMLLYEEKDGEVTILKAGNESLRGADNYGSDKCTLVIAFAKQGGARQYIAYNFESNRAQMGMSR